MTQTEWLYTCTSCFAQFRRALRNAGLVIVHRGWLFMMLESLEQFQLQIQYFKVSKYVSKCNK